MSVTLVNLLALATSVPYATQITSLSNQTSTAANLTFLAYDQRFTRIAGQNPTSLLIKKSDRPFAHEAGIYLPRTNSIYVTSSFVSKQEAVYVTTVDLDTLTTEEKPINGVIYPNGGCTYPYPYPASGPASISKTQQLLFAVFGSNTDLPGLYLANPTRNTSKPVITSFLGARNFTGLNDVVVHGRTGDLWFTDTPYAFRFGLRPKPEVPSQTYRFVPKTGELVVVADEQNIPNGLEFSPDFKRLYVTDTQQSETKAAGKSTIYVYDVMADKRLENRRVFAYADFGIPDGIHTDDEGNVYSAVGDGVSVWNPDGVLLGKIIVGRSCANFAFVQEGMLLFCDTELWLARIAARGRLIGIQSERQ